MFANTPFRVEGFLLVADAKQLRDTLRGRGLRATEARIRVLGVLIGADRPLSHAEVCDRVADGGFDRATVYRNLTDLVEVGLARRSDVGDHIWRFEWTDGPHDHAHFLCTECGTVCCLPATAVQVQGVARVSEIHVRGVCSTCA